MSQLYPDQVRAELESEFGRKIAHCADPQPGSVLQETASFVLKDCTNILNKGQRTEALCPFVSPARMQQALFLVEAKPGTRTVAQVQEELRLYQKMYEKLWAADPSRKALALVIVFSEVKGPELEEAMAPGDPMNEEILNAGILPGSFYPGCNLVASFDSTFLPQQSPWPIVVFRPLLASDWKFLFRVESWREIYHQRFGERPESQAHVRCPIFRLKRKFRHLLAKWTPFVKMNTAMNPGARLVDES